jgi:hypothetical protein
MPGANRVVPSRGKAAGVADEQIRLCGLAEDAVVDVGVPGALSVRQPGAAMVESRIPNPEIEGVEITEGDARFRVDLGGGEANLELGGMDLRSVDVNIGAGALKMDLRGDPNRDYNVRVQGGVGEATVYLPKDAGISARATGGLGEISATGLEKRDGIWINPERAEASVTVHLDVKGGVGEIHLIR